MLPIFVVDEESAEVAISLIVVKYLCLCLKPNGFDFTLGDLMNETILLHVFSTVSNSYKSIMSFDYISIRYKCFNHHSFVLRSAVCVYDMHSVQKLNPLPIPELIFIGMLGS